MLGSRADAEDIVQETWLRWQKADRTAVNDPRAFLLRTVSRLCLDQLKSARARRETYIGPWLPEPIVEAPEMAQDPAAGLAADMSFGLMLVLERLSPLERACFLLHDVFETPFPEIAKLLGLEAGACRQHASRARKRLKEERPRFPVPAAQAQALAAAFLAAAAANDLSALQSMLSQDAIHYSDGGGKLGAALQPIQGAEAIARLYAALARKGADAGWTEFAPAAINGLPGVLFRAADGSLVSLVLEVIDGRISRLYMTLNPSKLQQIEAEHLRWMRLE